MSPAINRFASAPLTVYLEPPWLTAKVAEEENRWSAAIAIPPIRVNDTPLLLSTSRLLALVTNLLSVSGSLWSSHPRSSLSKLTSGEGIYPLHNHRTLMRLFHFEEQWRRNLSHCSTHIVCLLKFLYNFFGDIRTDRGDLDLVSGCNLQVGTRCLVLAKHCSLNRNPTRPVWKKLESRYYWAPLDCSRRDLYNPMVQLRCSLARYSWCQVQSPRGNARSALKDRFAHIQLKNTLRPTWRYCKLRFIVVSQDSPHSGWSMDILLFDLYSCITSLRFGACHESRAAVPGVESPDEPIPAP